MNLKGAIILGIGDDNSDNAEGTFYEGAMTIGYPSDATDNSVQADIVAAGYQTTAEGSSLNVAPTYPSKQMLQALSILVTQEPRSVSCWDRQLGQSALSSDRPTTQRLTPDATPFSRSTPLAASFVIMPMSLSCLLTTARHSLEKIPPSVPSPVLPKARLRPSARGVTQHGTGGTSVVDLCTLDPTVEHS